jgi:chromosome segregation ATPase
MRKFSARKIEERKKLKTRVEDLIQSCNKLNKEDKECQRHIEDINRRESSKKVSKHQLQSDLKRTACEVEKLRENINNLVRDKDVTESRFCQLQKDCYKFSEQERDAKKELDIVMERLESTQRALSKTKSKVHTAGVKKVRFNVDNKTNSKRK